jgi:hypothetical protein
MCNRLVAAGRLVPATRPTGHNQELLGTEREERL